MLLGYVAVCLVAGLAALVFQICGAAGWLAGYREGFAAGAGWLPEEIPGRYVLTVTLVSVAVGLSWPATGTLFLINHFFPVPPKPPGRRRDPLPDTDPVEAPIWVQP